MMHHRTISPALLLTCMLISCKGENTEDLKIKKDFIVTLIESNDQKIKEIKGLLSDEPDSTTELLAKDVKRIESWRHQYLERRSRENLHLYADSVLSYLVQSRYFSDSI